MIESSQVKARANTELSGGLHAATARTAKKCSLSGAAGIWTARQHPKFAEACREAALAARVSAGDTWRCLNTSQGYVRSRVGSFSFWVRLPAAAGSSTRPHPGSGGRATKSAQRLGGEAGSGAARPLVFLHGVGLGLVRHSELVRVLVS